MRYHLLALLLGASAQDFQYPDCEEGPLAENLVCDVSASPGERAAALVEAMSIDEKLLNLVKYASPHTHTTLHPSSPPLACEPSEK